MGDSVQRVEDDARRPYMSWTETVLRLGLAILFLYLFLVGVKSLETGIASFGSDVVDQIFGSVANPIAGLAAGILATVLVQSSSVSTATIVGLVGRTPVCLRHPPWAPTAVPRSPTRWPP